MKVPTVRFDWFALAETTQKVLEASGTPPAIASRVASSLIDANLTGHDSHGVLRIPSYLEMISNGTLNPSAEPELLCETAATALVDARRSWGHYAASWAMDLAVRKAGESGTCTVVLRNCNHIGRLGEFVEQAAARGFIGSVSVGAGGEGVGCTFPFGGKARALGTNPLAWGVPTAEGPPFIIDFATTVVAEGKVQVARAKGIPVSPGCIVDREGAPTTDPAEFYDGGSLLFAGGHKGYALSLLACLTGALNGQFQPQGWTIFGVVVQAINPLAFLPLVEYQDSVRHFLAGIKSVPSAPGCQVLYPGELEYRTRQVRRDAGIELPAITWDQIRESAVALGLQLPAAGT